MKADADQLAMSQLRHSLVANLAEGRDLLDVACGSGYALHLIGANARSVTGCDRDPLNIADASDTYPEGVFFLSDADSLNLPPESFDVVACLEAIYYFVDWQGFVATAYRLLRPAGTIVLTWPNPQRPDFSRSPSSTTYPTVEAMAEAAERAGFAGTCYGAFPLAELTTARRPLADAVRRFAVRHALIPSSMRLRSMVKRVMHRRLTPLSHVSLLAQPFEHLTPVDATSATNYAMLYFVGHKPAGAAL